MPIEIEVCERVLDHWASDGHKHAKYHAQIKGKPEIWACGKSAYEAIGDLVNAHHDQFSIRIIHLPKSSR